MNEPQKTSRNKSIAPKVFEKRLEKAAAGEAKRKNLIVYSVVVALAVFTLAALITYKMNSQSRQAAIKSETDPEWQQKGDRRAQFASGLNASIDATKARLASPEFSAAGTDNTDLILSADNVTDDDCFALANSNAVGGAAASGGFKNLICRNRNSGASYTRPLK